MNDETFMRLALEKAKEAEQREDVPIGAVLVQEGQVIAASGNRVEADHDPTAHAEILVIREASRQLGVPRLPECDLYVTLEPCAMCVGAIAMARIRRVIFAADDPKGGAVLHGPKFFTQPTCHHRPEIVNGIFAQESGEMLRNFFRRLR